MTRLRQVDDMGCSDKTKGYIRAWIEEWIRQLETIIDPQDIKARKIDFKNWKFFYFTDCSDIINKDPKCENPDTERNIWGKKQNAYLWLFLKYLIGETSHINENWKRCSHCGNNNCKLNGLPYRSGHYNYCPDCGRTKVVTYKDKGDKGLKFIKKLWDEYEKREEKE